jgi:hypothetical protein
MLDYFKFRWGDAWYSYGVGYEAILETSSTWTHINWLVDGTPFVMDLSGNENEFLKMLSECHVDQWNGNRYVNYNYFDGVLWELILGYSKRINIETDGINGFPDTFDIFMKKLHSDWQLPYSKIDSPSFPFKEHRIGVKVENKP